MAGTVSQRIEDRRADLGVTCTRMAEKLGTSPSSVSRRLAGKSEFTAEDIKTLAEWWGVSADELLGTSPLAVR